MDELNDSLTIHSFPELDDSDTKKLRDMVKNLGCNKKRKACVLFRHALGDAQAEEVTPFQL